MQGLLSLQLSGTPVRQVPFAHCSLPLHMLPSEHEVPSGTATWRQPSDGEHESLVHTFASLQFSTWQNTEQPSQLCGVPAVSQVSGNSTTPLPHVGHGTRHPDCVALVQVGIAVRLGDGVTLPLIDGGLRLGYTKRLTPSAGAVPPVVVLPSSHCSPCWSSTIPSPHRCG